jgi:hypothetical protein
MTYGLQNYTTGETFWLYPIPQSKNLVALMYRNKEGKDILVKQLTIGPSLDDQWIVRVNGRVIPTRTLEQLHELLTQYRVYPDLIDNLNQYRTKINKFR